MSETPLWVTRLTDGYSSGQAHAFILTGQIADYVTASTLPLEAYFRAMFANRILVFYDVARGFRFGSTSDREAFIMRAGLMPTDADLAPDPIMAALTGNSRPKDAPTVDEVDLPRAPDAALLAIETFLSARVEDADAKRGVAIIQHLETIAPDAPMAQLSPPERATIVRLQQWGQAVETIGARGGMVIATTSTAAGVHPDIRAAAARWDVIAIPVPDEGQRAAFWRFLVDSEYELEDGLTPELLARATAGLARVHLEDIALRSLNMNGRVSLDAVRERKASIIAGEFGDVIEIGEPTFGWEGIGGKQELKRWFNRNVVRPLREGNTRRVPKGVLMVGPAGTGKSVMAQAIAKETGVNFVEFNLARILGQFVGNSERNLEKALEMIRSLAPTIVFIDELDQAFQRGSGGDSGVSMRIFKRVMEFMADPAMRGKVVWLAASNRPDLIDAALKRAGRFDKIVPFLVPDHEERAAILDVMLARYGFGGMNLNLDPIASTTDGWTGAELESLVIKAIELAEDDASDRGLTYEHATITTDTMNEARTRLRAATQDVARMTRLALAEISDRDLVPPQYREAMDEAARAPRDDDEDDAPVSRRRRTL